MNTKQILIAVAVTVVGTIIGMVVYSKYQSRKNKTAVTTTPA